MASKNAAKRITQLLSQFVSTANGTEIEADSIHSNSDNPDHDPLFLEPLRRDVADLTTVLLRVVRTHEGIEMAQAVESLVDAGLQYNRMPNDDVSFERLHRLVIDTVERYQNRQQDLLTIVRAFNELLQLANLADGHHRIRRWRLFERSRGSILQPQMPNDAFKQLIREGHSPQEVSAAMAKQHIDFVLTAHPTQAVRRTILAKYRVIMHLLSVRDRNDLTPRSRQHIELEIERQILSVWKSSTVRKIAPTALDEARAGLSVIEDILWHAVPDFLRAVDESLEKVKAPPLPFGVSTVRITSWIGGDRDGNPNVTSEVTKKVANISRYRAASLYYESVDSLMWLLSMTTASQELRILADSYLKASKISALNERFSTGLSSEYMRDTRATDEIYRIVLATVRERLFITRQFYEHKMNGNEVAAAALCASHPFSIYTHCDDLMHPLMACYRSLVECGDEIIAQGQLADLVKRLQTFGLALAKLDIRQESTRHSETLDAITRYLNIGSYIEWSEERRMEFLLAELSSKRPLINWEVFFQSEFAKFQLTSEVLRTFRAIKEIGVEALNVYVISMTTRPSDILAVYLLQREAGVERPMHVVPLFETQVDLENSRNIITKLLSIDLYKQLVGDRIQIMLGYSDSSKDAGRIMSVWALYRAQEDLVKIGTEHGVQVDFFHGRGGTPSRGGGPQHQSILSQPAGSIHDRLRVTIQGETIFQQFGDSKTARISLGRYSSATMLATMGKSSTIKPEWRDTMETMAHVSSAHYRAFVHQKAFIEYFYKATPINELSNLKLGSRPAKRRQIGGIETLRAIPWVFSFSQQRSHLSVWLGVAAAFSDQIDQGNLELLRNMAKNWPFFNSLLNLISMVLIKADGRVVQVYDEVLVPEERLRLIGKRIRDELEQTIDLVKKVLNVEKLLTATPQDAVIMRSVQARLPFGAAINLIQAEALKRLRASPDDAMLAEIVLTSIQAVSAVMQNTG